VQHQPPKGKNETSRITPHTANQNATGSNEKRAWTGPHSQQSRHHRILAQLTGSTSRVLPDGGVWGCGDPISPMPNSAFSLTISSHIAFEAVEENVKALSCHKALYI